MSKPSPLSSVPVMSQRPVRMATLGELVLEAATWVNPRSRTGLDEPRIAALGASIQAEGLQDPLKVQRVYANDGEVVTLVVDGQRRFYALSLHHNEDHAVPVVDVWDEPVELTEARADALMDIALSTLEREGLSSFELATVAAAMKGRGATGESIAHRIRRSASWVSKMLKAMTAATPELLVQWRDGNVTDEQFKDLAEVKQPEAQAAKVADVVKAREDGNAGEARTRAKEAKAESKPAHKPEPELEPEPEPMDNHDVQAAEPERAPKADKPKPPPMATRALLEDVAGLSDRRRPTNDYVKGVMHGVELALGRVTIDQFDRAWSKYVERVERG